MVSNQQTNFLLLLLLFLPLHFLLLFFFFFFFCTLAELSGLLYWWDFYLCSCVFTTQVVLFLLQVITLVREGYEEMQVNDLVRQKDNGNNALQKVEKQRRKRTGMRNLGWSSWDSKAGGEPVSLVLCPPWAKFFWSLSDLGPAKALDRWVKLFRLIAEFRSLKTAE